MGHSPTGQPQTTQRDILLWNNLLRDVLLWDILPQDIFPLEILPWENLLCLLKNDVLWKHLLQCGGSTVIVYLMKLMARHEKTAVCCVL